MKSEEEIVSGFVEIDPKDNFKSIKETLTRMGVPSGKKPELYQSCHILHKKGKFYIVHFKEMFLLDGKETSLDDMDIKRRNKIANLLQEWNLCTIKNPEKVTEQCGIKSLLVIPFSDKMNWSLVSKYTIGKQKNISKLV